MKRLLIKTLIIIIGSVSLAILIPNFLKLNKTIVFPSTSEFISWALPLFALTWLVSYMSRTKESPSILLDGYHEFFNEKNQLTKKGNFSGGRQVDGTRHVYNKDGTLSHIEKCVNGSYSKDI